MRSPRLLRRADAESSARPRRRPGAALSAMLAGAALALALPAFAYNHDQHQGIVALGYKAMVGAVLEKGCFPPFGAALSQTTPSLRTTPFGYCEGDASSCQARWNTLLDEFERSMRYLRSIDASLAAPRPNCHDPRGAGNTLGTVNIGVDRYYDREPGDQRGFCGTVQFNSGGCSAPVGLCDSDSIYQYLGPNDHTGDVLGYWATAPDDDASNTALGFKPTSALGLHKTIDIVNDGLEVGVAALAAPLSVRGSSSRAATSIASTKPSGSPTTRFRPRSCSASCR